MPSNIESYPFAERPGEEIGKGFVSKVKELGPDWVIKEFNPIKPDGSAKDGMAYERSQNLRHIRELQETQRILSQDFIYGDKMIPTYWVLGSDENGKEKYFTVQRKFSGETVQDIIEKGNHSLQYNQRFTEYFNENKELRAQLLELMWGTKRALVETGVFDDFHVGNIAVIIEPDTNPKLKVFDIQNMVGVQKLLYGNSLESPEFRKHILDNVEKHASRLEKYEKWLGVTEQEKVALNRKYGIENGKYGEIINNLLQMREQVK